MAAGFALPLSSQGAVETPDSSAGIEGVSTKPVSCPRELKKSNINGLFGELCSVGYTVSAQ